MKAVITVLCSLGSNTINAARRVAVGMINSTQNVHVRIVEPALPLSLESRRSIMDKDEFNSVQQRDQEIINAVINSDIVVFMTPVFASDVLPGTVEWIRDVLGLHRLDGKICASLSTYDSFVGVADITLARELRALGGNVISVHPIWIPDTYALFRPKKCESSFALCNEIGAHLVHAVSGCERTEFEQHSEQFASYASEHGPSIKDRILAGIARITCQKMLGTISVDKTKCGGCRGCTNRCPTGALKMPESKDIEDIVSPQWDKKQCIGCGQCVSACTTGALSASTIPVKSLERQMCNQERIKNEITQFEQTEEEKRMSLFKRISGFLQLIKMWCRSIWIAIKHPFTMILCGFLYMIYALIWAVSPRSSSLKCANKKDGDGNGEKKISRNPRVTLPKRRAPSQIHLRIRKEREEKNEISSSTSNSDREQAKRASAGSAVVGGYGILYSVRAADFLFAPRKGRNIEAELLEEANKKNEEESYEVVPKKVLAPKDLPKLIMVKGRRRPFCKQVERTWQSLNSGDCFVLDEGKYGKTVFQWNGRYTNRIKKGKAMDIAKNIRDKERFNSRVVIVDEGREPPDFWTALGGEPPSGQHIAGKESSGNDEEIERVYSKYITLYEAVAKQEITRTSSKGTAEVSLENVSNGKSMVKSMLVPGHCYILDCMSEVFVWTDSHVSASLRRGALASAESLAEKHARQCWVAPVYHEWAGNEQVMFRERFLGWNTPPISVGVSAPAAKNDATVPITEQKVNIAEIYDGHPCVVDDEMVDDGNGSVTVFLVEDFRRIRLEDDGVGDFYSGDSYVVLYSYVWKNKDCYVIYYWQGRSATVLNRGSSAALTTELDDKLKATVEAALSKEVRVVQGKEPRHFHTIFADKFIVHDGKDPRHCNTSSSSPSSSSSSSTELEPEKNRMYHIYGTNEFDTHAVEKTCAIPENLSSSGVFWIIDMTNKSGFTWIGRFSNDFERKYSEVVGPRLENRYGISLTKIDEGSEPANFWHALGCSAESITPECIKYPHKEYGSRITGRLFVCSIASGSFIVEEIDHFTQDDLDPEDAIILDIHDTVYVWIGLRSHPAEKRLAMTTAIEYCEYASKKDKTRPSKIPCLCVKQNEEPITFTSVFHGWQEKPSRAMTKWFTLKQQSKKVERSYDGNTSDVAEMLKELSQKFSYEDLVAKKYPKGIDVSALENYLEDEEFERLFKMSREEFAKLPAWKKVRIKHSLKLW